MLLLELQFPIDEDIAVETDIKMSDVFLYFFWMPFPNSTIVITWRNEPTL